MKPIVGTQYGHGLLKLLFIFIVILLFTNPIRVSGLVSLWTRVGLVSGNLVSFPLPLSRMLSMVHRKVLGFLFPIECSPPTFSRSSVT